MIEKIKLLELKSRELEPTSHERDEYLDKVINYSRRFLENIDSLKAYQTTEDNGKGIYASPISDTPVNIDKILDIIEKHVDSSGINPASGGHLGYVPGGGIFPSALGDYLADITNKFAGMFYASPGAVRMENMLIRWMCEITGFPVETSAGNLTSGGSIANLVGIVTARDTANLKSKDFEKTVFYFTEQAHHSAFKALKIAGMGEAVIRKIPMDINFRMKAEALDKQIKSDKNDGLLPFFIYATAGTTNTGTVDPLEEIGEIAKKHNIWFHIDAAYGGFFLLTDEGKKVMKGCKNADSLIMDPHKGLFLPSGSGAILVKDDKKLFNSMNYNASYLQDADKFIEEYSPADLSPELSKHFRGLRMWLPLKLFGLVPFKASLNEKILLTRYFYEQIQKTEGIEVGPYPDLSIMIFRFVPKNADPDKFNEKLVQDIQKDGRIFLTSTRINNTFFIRLAVLNFRVHLSTIDLALEIIKDKIKLIS
ncbi:MAG: aminotransferase class V-fold PLP-dependent enzyme [Bacteroidota bacterium]|nr:aminotransferase class V-fold PLP-dependent enzyme [Bacteroidota bacterium]